jgi:hypothetical protein
VHPGQDLHRAGLFAIPGDGTQLVATGADQVGQDMSIPGIALGSRDTVALAGTSGLQRVDRVHLVPRRQPAQRPTGPGRHRTAKVAVNGAVACSADRSSHETSDTDQPSARPAAGDCVECRDLPSPGLLMSGKLGDLEDTVQALREQSQREAPPEAGEPQQHGEVPN